MARDYVECGTSPCDEDCVQVGSPDYMRRSRIEAKAYIEALRKKFGSEPEGAELSIKRFEHDFGPYLEVVCYFEEDNEEANDYAYKCEEDGPTTWEEAGMNAPDLD